MELKVNSKAKVVLNWAAFFTAALCMADSRQAKRITGGIPRGSSSYRFTVWDEEGHEVDGISCPSDATGDGIEWLRWKANISRDFIYPMILPLTFSIDEKLVAKWRIILLGDRCQCELQRLL